MIEDDVEAEQRGLDLFKFAAPPGVRSQVRVCIRPSGPYHTSPDPSQPALSTGHHN